MNLATLLLAAIALSIERAAPAVLRIQGDPGGRVCGLDRRSRRRLAE
jgi:hypothetical protein